MVFNLILLIYTLIFKPSLYKFTNRLNIFISLCFIVYEALLFRYTIAEKTDQEQNTTSIACLAIQGLIILVIIIWMIYRFLILIAERCFGKKYSYEFEVEVKKKKREYGKIKEDSIRDLTIDGEKKNRV